MRVFSITTLLLIEKIDFSSPFYDFEASMIKSLFAEIYGEDGEEWIEYYLWEVPFIKEPKAKQDGEPVDLTSDESFYKFLEEKYGKRN